MPPGLMESCTTFKRRTGTSGISGQLYETKLLSLLYFRAIHDDRITEFQLASNVDDIGTFDDICFKATVEGFSKPVLVFIQAKHRENKNQTLKIDLNTYFISYLKIKQRLVSSNKDMLFDGKFDDSECLFVIYTTARDEFNNDSIVESSFCSILNDLIGTGGTAKQPYNQKQDIEYCCKIVIENQIISLAELIAKIIMDKNEDFQQMLSSKNENMLRYHVILGRKVLEISEIQLQPKIHRIATFRQDFFDTNEEYLTLFRDTLFKEILKKRDKPTDIENLLSVFIAEPNDAEKLSKLIGTVITYNSGKENVMFLEIDKKYTESVNRFKTQLNQVNVCRLTVDKAVILAAKEILLSKDFKLKVPVAFGNKDITISKTSRIDYLTPIMTNLLDEYKSSKIVTIDESLEHGFLQLNGGIAGAIGNIFVLDDNTKLMKITDNVDALGTDARNLYENLNTKIGLINKDRSGDKIPNLSEYKFCFKGNKFPKLLLEYNEHEEYLAKDFLNKLLIYSNQADEKSVEIKLKNEIEENIEYSVYIQAKTDAIFLKYHNKIQKWWMLPKEAPYLTKQNEIFERDTSYIIEDPLMISLSVPYVRKIKQDLIYTFTEDAVRSLNLQDLGLSTIIVTEYSGLTVVKVMQHLENKNHVVLNLEDIVNLPTEERNALRIELTNTNKEKVVILVCNKIQQSVNEKKTFENVAKAVRDKKTIIITNDSSVTLINKYFARKKTKIVHDEKFSLDDFCRESKDSIMDSGKVKFDGLEVELKDLIK